MHLTYLATIDDCLYSHLIAVVNKGWVSIPHRRGLVLEKLENTHVPLVFLLFFIPEYI